ncbi:unnamed protein product [Peniophora sp. CBMAI 1063]|nr:unnamed protein product [Peniophora sp. CBMAI 1063]
MAPSALSLPELLEQIFRHFDARTLLAVGRVSTLFNTMAQEEWRYRVHKYTGPFVTDVNHFYFILGGVEGVVSGSTALAVILRGSPFGDFLSPTSDLDIYVPSQAASDEMVRYFAEFEGYQVDSTTVASGDHVMKRKPESIVSLTRLRRVKDDLVRSVDIIVGAKDAATTPLFSFWGSLVMNYISATSVVCSYPRLTLDGRFFVRPGVARSSIAEPLDKYRSRGFISALHRGHSAGCKSLQSYCPGRFRHTEDPASMRVDWQSRPGYTLPYCVKSPSSVPAAYWKWETCSFVKYDLPYEEISKDGCAVGRL